jgi:WD40 repeat protein
MAYSHDGTWIVSGSGDGKVRVCDAQSGALIRTITCHSGFASSVACSHDGTRTLSGSADKTVRVWNAQTGGAIHALEGRGDRLTFATLSICGKRIVSAASSRGSVVRVWDALNGTCLHSLNLEPTGRIVLVIFLDSGIAR